MAHTFEQPIHWFCLLFLSQSLAVRIIAIKSISSLTRRINAGTTRAVVQRFLLLFMQLKSWWLGLCRILPKSFRKFGAFFCNFVFVIVVNIVAVPVGFRNIPGHIRLVIEFFLLQISPRRMWAELKSKNKFIKNLKILSSMSVLQLDTLSIFIKCRLGSGKV